MFSRPRSISFFTMRCTIRRDRRPQIPPGTRTAKPGIRLLSNVAFFQGKVKAYESSLVELTEMNARERKAAVFQLDVPLTSLKPGF